MQGRERTSHVKYEKRQKTNSQLGARGYLDRLAGAPGTDLGSETIRMLRQLDQEVRIEVDTRGCAAAIVEDQKESSSEASQSSTFSKGIRPR
jgi:hypothetical protein